MHEMQNRMKIAFCVKPPLPSILLADKEGPHLKFSGGGLSWPSAGTGIVLACSSGNYVLPRFHQSSL